MVDIYNNTSVENIILTALAMVVLMILWWCMYTFIRAIFLFIFAGTKEENKKKWRNSIRFMIIWIILTIVLLLLFPVLFKAMNVPWYDKYTPQNVFNRVGDIINSAFKLWNFIKESQQENKYRGNLYYDVDKQESISPEYDL
jgi:ABC-type Fe3+ transport system permease subunit